MSNINLENAPTLISSSLGPLQAVEKFLIENQDEIEQWLKQQFEETPPPIYCSVDLRNAGFKLAPIDTNLFPAGFNNLNPDFMPLCVHAVKTAMDGICSSVNEVILIPEDHTRNLYYYENIAVIKQIFTNAGYKVRIGSLLPDLKEKMEITLPSGGSIELEPLRRQGDKVTVDGFSPCVVLLNNDLSAGVPDVLKNLQQYIMPPLSAGWFTRFKSVHFKHYEQVANEFAEHFGLDPWLLSPMFRHCENVDFMIKDGEACVIKHCKDLLAAISAKYEQYGIDQKPFLVIKADAGTYGMAVMMIQDPEELLSMNRKERTRMASIKGGREVRRVIIQEGVHTIETFGEDGFTAEPVIYMIGRYVVGGFYRTHGTRGNDENLNAPGMSFKPLEFEPVNADSREMKASRFFAYSVVARLALLAAAKELQEAEA